MADKQADKTDKNPQADLQQVVTPIKEANNVLVAINSDPTVDQLASCIGLTLVLNKLGKHATAVFSGEVPSTLEFLKPQETLEKDTDGLRDFIIALDKSKADKLRYKVENEVVKIFITPYRTSIDEGDLQFSQGDFNVDVVVALGVDDKKHLDKAILDHGRILHDATVISINTQNKSSLGMVNWSSQEASSLCEMVTDVVQSLSKDVLDNQNSTAFLTGIVAETERYSNEKATPHTMSVAAALMSAGASTQLVSNELDSAITSQGLPSLSGNSDESSLGGKTGNSDGELDIDHTGEKEDDNKPQEEDEDKDRTSAKAKDEYLEHLNLSEDPDNATPNSEDNASEASGDEKSSEDKPPVSRLIKDPPHFTGQLTANTTPEEKQYTGSTDPLSNLPDSALLGQKQGVKTPDDNKADDSSNNSLQQKVDQTLSEIEESVSSPHIGQEDEQKQTEKTSPPPSLEEARKAAETAASENERPHPKQDTGSTELGSNLNGSPPESYSTDPNKDDLPPPPVPPPISPNS